jgi:DNA-binding response OmpR family regulator
VLVVEDDEDLLRMMQRMLSPYVDVITATDGEQALKLITVGPVPELLVTDWMMPRKDGITLIRELKQDERTRAIPVVILTAKTAPRDVVLGINTGARHYVTKPFKPDDLINKVKKALRLP